MVRKLSFEDPYQVHRFPFWIMFLLTVAYGMGLFFLVDDFNSGRSVPSKLAVAFLVCGIIYLFVLTNRIVLTPNGFYYVLGISWKGGSVWGIRLRIIKWDSCYIGLYLGWPFYALNAHATAFTIPIFTRFLITDHAKACRFIYTHAKGKAQIEPKALKFLEKISQPEKTAEPKNA